MPSLSSPCCVYGSPCFSVCINPKCKKYGMICQKGYQTKEECYLFHQQCAQIKWSQLQKMATQNTYTSSEQFVQFRLRVQRMFIGAIQKIKQEQQKFRIWVKTFGHSLQVMKFIKLINDKSFQEISGSLVSPVINSFFKDQNNISRPPAILQQELREMQTQIQTSIQNINSLYLKASKRRVRQQHSLINIPTSSSQTEIQGEQKSMTRSQKFAGDQEERRQRHQSQMKTAGYGNNLYRSAQNQRYNQQKERVQGSLTSQSQQMNKPRNQMMIKFNSKIYRHIQNIKRLFTQRKPVGFRLLYRASQHNFSIQEFHRLCDDVSNTLVLIDTEFSKVIGGFSANQWKSNKKQWVADKKKESFVFSLSLNQKYELNLPQFSISCNPQKGPIFGCCDICLVDNSNKEKSSAQFPISYNLNKKYHRGDQASFAFTGHPKGQYRTKQWQVFKVQFQ